MKSPANIKRDVRRTKDWAKTDAQSIDRAILANLANEDGRRMLWWLLQIGRVNTQPFSLSPHTTSFNCGEMNVGNQILARITDASPEGYLAMQKERANERTDRDSRLTSGDRDSSSGADEAGDDYGDDEAE